MPMAISSFILHSFIVQKEDREKISKDEEQLLCSSEHQKEYFQGRALFNVHWKYRISS